MRAKKIIQLNAAYKGKSILIIGNHPKAGKETTFARFKSTGRGEMANMIVKDKDGEEIELKHDNVFVIQEKIVNGNSNLNIN